MSSVGMGGGSPQPSTSGFDVLLRRLDEDPERAGLAFEQLRRTLLRFFGWNRVPIPEDAADDTITRVARRLAEGHVIQDVSDFALGVARLVLRESWRAGKRFESLDDAGAERWAAPPEPEPEPDVSRHLERCLALLPDDARALVLAYYAGVPGQDKIRARNALAGTHGLTPNALRSRVQRLRDRLEECVRARLHDTLRAVTSLRTERPR
jgi:DNA-directed RNA polymerase specialized sigma24 family protein